MYKNAGVKPNKMAVKLKIKAQTGKTQALF
jgi:hypothetical protein